MEKDSKLDSSLASLIQTHGEYKVTPYVDHHRYSDAVYEVIFRTCCG